MIPVTLWDSRFCSSLSIRISRRRLTTISSTILASSVELSRVSAACATLEISSLLALIYEYTLAKGHSGMVMSENRAIYNSERYKFITKLIDCHKLSILHPYNYPGGCCI